MAGEVQSPTALVQRYLQSKGLPLNAQNINRALQMNADHPGSIPGLTSQAPPSPDAAPQAQSHKRASQPGLPIPPIPPGAASPSQASPQPTAQTQQTQAPSHDWLAALIETILGGGAGLAKGLVGSKGSDAPLTLGMRPNEAEFMGNRGMPPTALPGGSQGQLQGPTQAGDPLQLALQKAIEGQGVSTTPGQPQVSGQPAPQQLPAPGERPAIPMRDGTSGPTIPLGPPTPGMGEPLNMSAVRPQMPEMGSGINWSKIMNIVEGAGPILRHLRP